MSRKKLSREMQEKVSLNWLANKSMLPFYLFRDKYNFLIDKENSDIEKFSKYSGMQKEDMYKLSALDIIYNLPLWYWHMDNVLGNVKKRPERINLASYLHPSLNKLDFNYNGEKVTGSINLDF